MAQRNSSKKRSPLQILWHKVWSYKGRLMQARTTINMLKYDFPEFDSRSIKDAIKVIEHLTSRLEVLYKLRKTKMRYKRNK